VEGKPTFDVRVDGKVTRLQGEEIGKGPVRIEAYLGPKNMRLIVNSGEKLATASPGLIPVQPKDGVSVGLDALSSAGDYEAPNRFNGTVLSTRISAGGEPPAVAAVMDRVELEAGFKSHDRALFVKEGWIRDPYISRGSDDWFYLTGTTPNPGDSREQSDPYNTGLGEQSLVGWKAQVFRSRDLIDWESIGTPFSLKDGIWYGADRAAFDDSDLEQWRLWAPELHWVEEMNRWALVHTSPYPLKKANLAISGSDKVSGPWENPMGTAIERRHDPSLFKDDDDTWWLIWGATTIAPLKPGFTDFASEPVNIHPAGNTEKMGHEGCLIMKIEGKYVLFGTGWSTHMGRRGSYNLYYATADKITGPYSERKFAGRFLGHGTPFQDNDGRWWCTAFYNGNVPPVSRVGIQDRDLSETAQTINQRGTTLVPLEVKLKKNGELYIRAKDPDYATVGPDEAQEFE
jgi:arylsulfatase